MRKTKIPTIIGVLLLVAAVAVGVFLVQGQQVFRLGATVETSPANVRITNITDSSFTVSWTTEKETTGFLKYGEGSSFNRTELDEIGENSTVHYVTVQGLKSQTLYSFKINSGGVDYDLQGALWQVTTGPVLLTPEADIVSGTVLTASGTPVANAIVYINVGGGSPLSTTTSGKGAWLLNIKLARENSLASYITVDQVNTLLEISIQAGAAGAASAQIYPQSAHPVPPITLGRTFDFKNLPPSITSDIPEASFELPEGSAQSSGFEVGEKSPSSQTQSVTLESLEDGEIINTQEPEFFGEGPVGAELTITVESDPVTETVDVDASGSWGWSPPSNLSEGPHTITISWRDAGGILRTLKRTFIVQAAEGPAFESTPSASTTPTPTPAASASPTPTASPSATFSPTPTSTALPDAGSLTPTYALSIMGIILLMFSGFFAQHARRQ